MGILFWVLSSTLASVINEKGKKCQPLILLLIFSLHRKTVNFLHSSLLVYTFYYSIYYSWCTNKADLKVKVDSDSSNFLTTLNMI